MDQASSQVELLAQSPGRADGTDYDVVSYFPWTFQDHRKFSECRQIDWSDPNIIGMWYGVVKKWTGVAAVCGRNACENTIRFVRTTPQNPLQILHQVEIAIGQKETAGIRCICWSFDPKTLAPLVLLGGMSGNITVYSPELKAIFSVIRGHGGRITSLNTHPRNPHIIVSTSRDKTARLWCLDLPAEMRITSADPGANRLGPMFGSPLTAGEKEAMGPGRCFALTVGGHSEGHNATLLDACFHPQFNILATSGVDHCIKLWAFDSPPLPTTRDAILANLVRPIFSSNNLHHAMVSSIHWLSASVLISQSAQSQTSATQEPFPAKIVVWKWLAYEPYEKAISNGVEYVKDTINAVDSHSYKILADIPLAYPSQKLSFSQNLVILCSRSHTRILDPARFEPRGRLAGSDTPLVEADLYYEDAVGRAEVVEQRKRLLWEQAASGSQTPSSMGEVATIQLEDVEEDTIFNVAMSHGMLLRVGNKERLRVWRLRPPVPSQRD